jgi:hypothetical protein
MFFLCPVLLLLLLFTYLFISGCAGSSLLQGLFSSCGERGFIEV